MTLQQLKEEARKSIKGFVDEADVTFIESILAEYIDKAVKSTKEENIEIVKDWFTLPPQYRTKEKLLKSLKDN